MNRAFLSPRPARTVENDCGGSRLQFFVLPVCFGPSVSSAQQTSKQTTTSTSGASSPSTAGDKSPINTGVSIGDKASVVYNDSVNTSDAPAVTKAAFDAITTLVGQALSGLNKTAATTADTVAQQGDQTGQLVSAILAQDQATAANTASGGQTNTNTTVLEVVVIAAACLLAWMFFGKK
jgi:hypothetical protein